MYRTFSADKITPGMFLQAVVASQEEKGYILDLGFKDGAKGFLKFSAADNLSVGDLVQVTAKSASSKLVKCECVMTTCVTSTDSVVVNEHTLRPGFLVNAKVAKIYENGLDVTYLGGMLGSVFVDHIGRELATRFKVGEKI